MHSPTEKSITIISKNIEIFLALYIIVCYDGRAVKAEYTMKGGRTMTNRITINRFKHLGNNKISGRLRA